MIDTELKKLKEMLWSAADTLRADSGLKSTEYATPILGLIFLRFADSKYREYEHEILEEYNQNKGSRMERDISEIAIEKCGFYLPDEARYDYLLNLPESENIPEKVKDAMCMVENYTKTLADTLPKDEYYAVDGKDGKAVVKRLLKAFKDIPDNTTIDIFGEIYEYFLGEFALAEGQGGGQFFTPPSVVKYMVEVLAPVDGEIFDPACGSGGMFVQAAHYIQKHKQQGNPINLRAYGVEKDKSTVNLAKINMVLHNIRGTITEANSYYADPYDCLGKFDYVMANPPFNVDGVELEAVKNQERFNTYGVPQNKTKSKKSAGETVPNGNYLWINMFATSLKENKGKAALVMANSASDAGNSEKEIRMKLIESGVVSQMVTLPSNMFSTVTLPATLWFFDASHKKKEEILFIDARNIFTQVDRAHRKFTEEQIKNLAMISRLYEEKNEEYTVLLDEYQGEVLEKSALYHELQSTCSELVYHLYKDSANEMVKKYNDKTYVPSKKVHDFNGVEDYHLIEKDCIHTVEQASAIQSMVENHTKELKEQFHEVERGIHQNLDTASYKKEIMEAVDILNQLDVLKDEIVYFLDQCIWLQERFPQGIYQDVTGLCKVATLEGEDGIKDQDYSLNPGRYVGVVIEDDGMTEEEFKEEMRSLYVELEMLNQDARELESKIGENLKGLFNE